MRFKKFKIIILLVFLITGLSITGWSISTHYNITLETAEVQKELQNESQNEALQQAESNSIKPILFLISTGLIGLVGVRRQRKVPGSYQSRKISE